MPPSQSLLNGTTNATNKSSTTNKFLRVLTLASAFICFLSLHFSSAKWRSLQLELDQANQSCEKQIKDLTNKAQYATKNQQRMESLEKERDSQRVRLKEKNAEINQLKEELKKSKPTASAKMAMEVKKRNEELEEHIRELRVEMEEMKRGNEKEMQDFKMDSSEAYDGCSKREKKLRGELERCLGGGTGGGTEERSRSSSSSSSDSRIESRGDSVSSSIGDALRESKREQVQDVNDDESENKRPERDAVADDEEQQQEEEPPRALGDLDEEDEETKRKHDLRVERMERLEKQRQDQAKYWAKYQAKKRAKKEREVQENANGKNNDNDDNDDDEQEGLEENERGDGVVEGEDQQERRRRF